jgi:hypothetical protein
MPLSDVRLQVTEAWKERGTLRPMKLTTRARRKIMITLASFVAIGVLLAIRGSRKLR